MEEEDDSPSQKNLHAFSKKSGSKKSGGKMKTINLNSSSSDDLCEYLDPEEVFRAMCKKWLDKHKEELFDAWQEETQKLWEIRPKVQRKTKEK